MILRAIRKGEVIDGSDPIGRPDPMMVLSACDRTNVVYFCVEHATNMANAGNILLHAEPYPDGTRHSIVRWCSDCRKYEAVDQAQLDALTPARSGLPLTHGAQ